jgi:hypothetical protein
MKKSKNGYYKFYNSQGIYCRIKCNNVENNEVLIKFKQKNETNWMYHSPNKRFHSCLEVANYILKNLDNQNMIFKIIPINHSLKESINETKY